ncbi:non-lysosomal glucosylceramidase-like [Acanthaster planci]|uniref:Non-lysosomal glucosylceramidase n=1 Tax=Acanthaster planci TaxID=133434 RepID=A0A8B7YHL5_ACAPL|nr:non-lysosomal glucosylceramidase-like [Acanthaster planci]
MASETWESGNSMELSLEHFGVPEFGWRVPLDYEFPEKWGPLKGLRFFELIKLIPTFFRYLKFVWKMWMLGRRPFIDIVPIPFKTLYGVPIGGIGCGAINRGWKGEFCRWSLTPGIYTYNVVEVNQFIVRIQRPNQPVYQQVLYPGKVSNKHLTQSWQWHFPGDRAHYHGLYPRAWTVYRIPEQDVTLVCRQVSSVFPNDYKDTCLPVGVFVWEVDNHASTPVDVSIMFTWQNGIGAPSDKNGSRWNEGFCNKDTEGSCEGVLLHDDKSSMRCTMAVAAANQEGVKVSYCTDFDPNTSADEIWEDLLEDGHLNSSAVPTYETEEGELTAAAVCASDRVAKKSRGKMEFVLAWDMPRIHFKGNGHSYNRRYTRWFGHDGKAAIKLCSYALRSYSRWEKAIESWQKPILDEESYPAWYKSALFNELYFMTDGGSIWVESQEDQASSSAGDRTQDPSSRIAKLKKDMGMFAYLEGHEYRMFNTYDVHFYASFALTMLWPQLQLCFQDFIGTCVHATDDESYYQIASGQPAKRKLANCVPHDIGDPEEEPWKRINGYYQHDTCKWKDLNLKFVLITFRDFYQIQDLAFLREMYPKCKAVMETAKLQDIDDDGLIDNSGTADQTYDSWAMTGASAYCGGLWLAALRCMVEMAHILGHEDTDASEYSALLDKGRKSYEDKLWNGKYYNYDSNSKTCMADQTAGQWYLRACNLTKDRSGVDIFPTDHVLSALETIYQKNVLPFREGLLGATNGVKPNGKIDYSASLQCEEVWTGVTYGLAAHMIQEGLVKKGFQTASGIYHTCYNRAGLGFQTPEAILETQHFRSTGYMRPLAIWAMQWALENRHNRAASEDTTN